MATLIRRFPNFVDVDPSNRTVHEVETLEDLRNIDWVKEWEDRGEFDRFTIDRRSITNENVLMVEVLPEEGEERGKFWGIGFLKGDVEELPSWEKPV